MKLLLAALLVLALAIPALADTVNEHGLLMDPHGLPLPFGLDAETVTNTAAHYGPAADAHCARCYVAGRNECNAGPCPV